MQSVVEKIKSAEEGCLIPLSILEDHINTIRRAGFNRSQQLAYIIFEILRSSRNEELLELHIEEGGPELSPIDLAVPREFYINRKFTMMWIRRSIRSEKYDIEIGTYTGLSLEDPIDSSGLTNMALEAVEFLVQIVLADRNSIYYFDLSVIEPEYSRRSLGRTETRRTGSKIYRSTR